MSDQNKTHLSDYSENCQGAKHPNQYLIALNISSAKTKKQFNHIGSSKLDGINAFDLAEINKMNLGQLNLVKVSSFCGPEGLIWGYDIAVHAGLREKQIFELSDKKGKTVPVYSANPLVEAATELFGTVDDKHFPIMPGSICRAAWESVVCEEPGIPCAVIAIGIVEDRQKHACLLMEDAFVFPEDYKPTLAEHQEKALNAAARSVMSIAENQGSSCKEIFVGLSLVEVGPGEVGNALLIIPYFDLAQAAVPEGGIDSMKEMSLNSWVKEKVSN